LRRACFPQFFVPEILAGAMFPLGAAGYAAYAAGVSVPDTIAALALAWYGAETAMVKIVRWHLTPLYPLQAALRDLLLPALWIDAWVGTEFEWRGNQMSIAADTPAA
jgi:ceramide glucosyltransferase